MTHFVDWITIKQKHPQGGLPVVSDGYIVACDSDMEKLQWESLQHHKVEGSHDTALRLRCDGYEVSLSGNVGRFGRPDNLYNLDWDQTISKANSILDAYGLPPLTPGERTSHKNISEYDIRKGITSQWSGATVSRIDVTQNIECGSLANAQSVIEWLDRQSSSHIKKSRAGETTVQYGTGSSRYKTVFYIKSVEMKTHAKDRNQVLASSIYQHAEQSGIVRNELKANRLLLRDENLRYLGDITMGKLIELHTRKTQVINRVRVEENSFEIESLPPRLRLVANAYFHGENLRTMMPQSTWYRHAKALRAYGIDIAEPFNVSTFPISIRMIDIRPSQVPDWYWQESRYHEFRKAA